MRERERGRERVNSKRWEKEKNEKYRQLNENKTDLKKHTPT